MGLDDIMKRAFLGMLGLLMQAEAARGDESPLDIKVKANYRSIRFLEAPSKEMENFSSNALRVTAFEAYSFDENFTVESSQSTRIIDRNFFGNERFDSEKPAYTVDTASLAFQEGPLKITGGVFYDTLLSNNATRDPDLPATGFVVQYDTESNEDTKLTGRFAKYFASNMNNDPSLSQYNFEAVCSTTNESYSTIVSVMYSTIDEEVDHDGNVNEDGYDRFSSFGKITFDLPEDPLLSGMSLFGSYWRTFRDDNHHDAYVVGIEKELVDGIRCKVLYAERELSSIGADFHDDLAKQGKIFAAGGSVDIGEVFDLDKILGAEKIVADIVYKQSDIGVSAVQFGVNMTY